MAVEKNTAHKKKDSRKRLVLLDTHAIIHRAYHALPDFTSGKGEPTGALYGFSAMLIKLIKDLEPDYVIAAYDMPKPTFRHDAYKEYKAGRPKAEEDLAEQIKRSYDICRAFNIPVYQKEGFEADDVIGTIARKLEGEKDIDVVIASGDMDTLQLVEGKKVQVYTLRKGLSDTILYDESRVRERFGFPPELLPDFKGLRGDPSDNIPGVRGIGEKTATGLIQKFGPLEKILEALERDEEQFKRAGFKDRALKLLREGKEDALFSKVLAQIRYDAPIDFSLPEGAWRERASAEEVKSAFADLGFRSLSARVREIFPEAARDEAPPEEMSPEEAARLGIAVWLLDTNITNPNRDDILRFARTSSPREAKKRIDAAIKKEKGLRYVYEKIELPLTPVLKAAEERGILIDKAFFEKTSKQYHAELDTLERDIWRLAGEEFNINSPKQLGEILFEKLKVGEGRIKKTPTGAKSTRASELEKLRGKHEIIDKLLDYRELQKILSTYIDNMPNLLGSDGRLHTHFLQTGTTTGRIASQNPNLQNIPIRSELGRRVRNGFMATPEFSLFAFDYSQVELRIAAILSGDERLVRIFAAGKDVHAATASEIFKTPLGKVDKNMRRTAKVINFGILYGMGANALKDNLGVSRSEAEQYLDDYFSTFSQLADYIEEVKTEARKRGYTETYFGRRRYFPGLRSSVPYIRAAEERMAVNAPIQGTSADVTKLAMVRVSNLIRERGLGAKVHLLLQIHDELMYEIKKPVSMELLEAIKKEMESIIKEDVPLLIHVAQGATWGEMEDMSLN